jgi:hypothetical protein
MNKLDLLSFIYYHPYLGREDLFVFTNIKNLYSKLKELEEKKYINHLSYKGVAYYFIESLGFKILEIPGQFRKIDIEKRMFILSHYLDTNKFFKTLKIYSDKNNIEFTDFISDRFCSVKFLYLGKTFYINPDGFCIFNKESFYIEIDRSTENSFKILEKIDAYSSFYLSFEYLKYFKTFPTILFVVPDLKRKLLLINRLERFINSNKYMDELSFFKIITFSEFINDPILINKGR